jgi:asparagine synthase (glutamine-hydrolysing)
MSAIFGLIYLDGRPVQRESLDAMRSAMSQWGPDGVHTWYQGSAGLGFASLAITPESHYETMPLHDPERGISLVAAARLDNREELCDNFGIPLADRPTTPDGHLVMRAFQKWEEDCPRHLYGDWAYAAWDSRQRKLFLARDHLGNTGLYYSPQPPLFAFASSPEPLFAFGEIPCQLNESKLARFITFIPMGDDFETIFRDVQSLLPARSLVASPKGIQIHHYWCMEESPSIHPRSDEECLEGFLDRYRAAVRSRLPSTRPIGISLSSGLDSASVTALAAEALNNGEKKLVAFTSVPIHPAEHLVRGARADEWPLAHVVADQYPNIEHIPVRAESVTPIAGIRRALNIFRAPMHAAVNMFWIISMLDEARSRGIGTLLSGQLGNGSISWSGGRDRIFFLFMRGEWDAGLRSLAAWKSYHGSSWFRAIKHHILRPFLNPIWSQRRRILHPFDPPWAGLAAINPAFARRLGLRKAMRVHGHDISFSKPIAPLKERQLTLFRNGAAAGPIWHTFGSAFGLEVRDPAADVHLIEFCMGIPDEQYVHGGGDRMLLRRAMEGLLPLDVRCSTQRGKQAADVTLRLLDHVNEVDTVLDQLGASPAAAGYLDIKAMRHAWEELQAHQTPRTTIHTASLLLRGIMAGLFLESLEREIVQ